MKDRNLKSLLVPWHSTESCEFGDICLDSRLLNETDVFVAIKGSEGHGADYIPTVDSLKLAAVLIDESDLYACQCAEQSGQIFYEIPSLTLQLGVLAQNCYGQPGKEIEITAVTGTNGKSSIVYLLAQAFSKLGFVAKMMGTIGNGSWDSSTESQRTTADVFSVYRQLRKWADMGVTHVAMEVSSHALVQGRIAGLQIKHAVFTNLSRDHLDYHADMHEYGDAKAQLLKQPGVEFVHLNRDDAWVAQLGATNNRQELVSLSSQHDCHITDAECIRAKSVVTRISGCEFDLYVQSSGKLIPALHISNDLVGRFQVDNLLAVISVLFKSGVSYQKLEALCSQMVTVPGRMQTLHSNCCDVIVDYAHTPDGLAAALGSLRAIHNGSISCVFGCGGDRDRGKRPLMAKVVEKFSDQIVVTSDNPRCESQEQIKADIKQGFEQLHNVVFIDDRREAIKWSLKTASKNSVIMLAGKGHESGQYIKGQVLPFDDVSVAREELEAMSC